MDVVRFIGPSGTGKSTLSLQIAEEYDIDLIIDDGLVVDKKGNFVAGKVAKLISNDFEYIYNLSLFSDTNEALMVHNAILSYNPNSKLLVLATDEDSLNTILQNLNISSNILQTLTIYDYYSKEKIMLNQIQRVKNFEHTVPMNYESIMALSENSSYTIKFKDGVCIVENDLDGTLQTIYQGQKDRIEQYLTDHYLSL